MKIYAKVKKVNIYLVGDMYIIYIYRNKKLNPIQFGAPSKTYNKEHIRSLLKHYGFELVKFEDLPE
jgi:hypothetical protein